MYDILKAKIEGLAGKWIFIGPWSDHSLSMSLTDSLTIGICLKFNELT